MQPIEKALTQPRHNLSLKFYGVYYFLLNCTEQKLDDNSQWSLDNRSRVIEGLNLLFMIFVNTNNTTCDLVKMTKFISKTISESKDNRVNNFYNGVGRQIYYLDHQPCDTFNSNLPSFKKYQLQSIIQLADYLVRKFPNYYQSMPLLSKTQKLKIHMVFMTIEELFKPQPSYYVIRTQLKSYSDYRDQYFCFKKCHLFNKHPKPGTLRYILNDVANAIEKNEFKDNALLLIKNGLVKKPGALVLQ